MTNRSRATAAALVIGILVIGRAEASPTLDEWVAANASPTERVLCTRQRGSEFFFIALAPRHRVRLGMRLDFTRFTLAHEFSYAWKIGNEAAASIVAKIQPTSIKGQYVREGSRMYMDDVQYQTLTTGESKVLRVSVEIHKCRVWSRTLSTCEIGAQAYTVKLCDAKL